MNYWWKENKTFAIPVGAGAIAVLAWYLLFLSPLEAGTEKARDERRRQETLLTALMHAGVPSEDTVRRAGLDAQRLKEEIEDLKEAVEFRVEEAFRPREGKSPAEHLGSAREDLRKLFEAKCAEHNVAPISDKRLGFPSSFQEISSEVAEEWLVRLAMLKRAGLLAIQHVERFENLQCVPGEYQDAPLVRPDRFLNKLEIRFRVTGPSDGLLRFLHALQAKGTFLAVEDFATTPADPGRDLVTAEVALSALRVNPEAALAGGEGDEE